MSFPSLLNPAASPSPSPPPSPPLGLLAFRVPEIRGEPQIDRGSVVGRDKKKKTVVVAFPLRRRLGSYGGGGGREGKEEQERRRTPRTDPSDSPYVLEWQIPTFQAQIFAHAFKASLY